MSNTNAPALRRSTRSTRRAHPIDPPFWESVGFDNITARNIANFTYFVDSVQRKEHETFTSPYQHEGRNKFVPYHEQLLPHWRVFTKAILETATGRDLSFSAVALPRPVLNIVVPCITSVSRLHILELEQNKLDRDGFIAVAEILRNQPTICDLALPKNDLVDVESAQALSDAVAAHENLKKLRLPSCGIGRNAEVLSVILEGCTDLTVLDLRDNHIGGTDEEVSTVAKFISDNHEVYNLDLEANVFSDDSVPKLRAALKKNTKLFMLDISENELTVNGRKEMIKAVFDTTSLNAAYESNHHCKLIVSSRCNRQQSSWSSFFIGPTGGEEAVPFEQEMQTLNRLNEPHMAKGGYKIIQALNTDIEDGDSRKVNLPYLNDVPLELMPKVLRLVQLEVSIKRNTFGFFGMGEDGFISLGYNSDGECISSVFRVLKAWPSLFEYGGSGCRSVKKPAIRKRRGKRKR